MGNKKRKNVSTGKGFTINTNNVGKVFSDLRNLINTPRDPSSPWFRGIKKAYVATVLEGRGTQENPYREVKYVFDGEMNQIGEIDPNAKS